MWEDTGRACKITKLERMDEMEDIANGNCSPGLSLEKRELLGRLAGILEETGEDRTCDLLRDCPVHGSCDECIASNSKGSMRETIEALKEVARG